jgi:hypothetical protein
MRGHNEYKIHATGRITVQRYAEASEDAVENNRLLSEGYMILDPGPLA